MGAIKERRKKEAKAQTLEDFLTSMTDQIMEQTEKMTSVTTILVDLSQELGLVIKDLMKLSAESRDELGECLKKIQQHTRLGSVPEPEDGERLIETAWIAKGRVDGYLYAVTQIRKVCENVLGRKHETKH